MKEIKTFLKNGGLYLIAAIVNTIIMILCAIDWASEHGLHGCLVAVFILLPWTLLFWSQYEFVQEKNVFIRVCLRLSGIATEANAALDRYIAIYGKLPSEEESEKQNSENPEKEK